ncbi:glycoside hydrolase family 68 protein [Paenibacillus tarimensis]
MKKKFHSKLGKMVLCTTILAGSLLSGAASAKQSNWDVQDEYTAVWSRQAAEQVKLTDENTAPKIDTNFELAAPDVWVWDTWPLQNRDGSLAVVNGYRIAFALVAPRTFGWNDRHTEARIGLFYSKDGIDWTYAGIPYDYDKAYGHMQWAGSAMLDKKGKVHLFYTATTDMNAGGGKEWDQNGWVQRAEQRLAKTTFEIKANENGVKLINEGKHQIIAEPDGKYYETIEQFYDGGHNITAFRDPFFFQDPNTGKEYILFEGQVGGKSSEQKLKPENIGDEEYRKTHTVPERAELYDGNIGIAEVLDKDASELKLLPPLLESIGTNHQVERPHMYIKGDDYYLMTISHTFTYAPGLTGPDGVYGFHNKGGIRGDYKPLNGSGLVVANPKESPYQAYSWMVLPDETAISFINEPLDENGNVKHGGTFAPTLQLSFEGDKTKITGELQHGEIRDFGPYLSAKKLEKQQKQQASETQIITTHWTREQASMIEQNEDNTLPYTDIKKLEKMTPDYHIWDTWPLMDRDGNIASYKGYKVLFALSAPSDVLPGKVHDIATIRYFISKNGNDWEFVGDLFPENTALGSRQWAGSAMLDGDKIYAFYTATGHQGEKNLTYEQRLAMGVGQISVDGKQGVKFTNWAPHRIIMEPDGEYYQTLEQAKQGEGGGYAFRDPMWFKDPKTKKEYLLFEGQSGGALADRELKPEYIGSDEYQQENTVPEGAKHANANIGIIEVVQGDFNKLELLPPLLEANYVNEELERPHIVVKNGKYYLFTDSHINKYAEGLQGPEGLYGFVSDRLGGGYKPLNGSGLVIANPENNPYQAYSWLVLPSLNVVGFAHFGDLNGMSIGEIGNQSPEFQFEHWGGTLPPTVQISIKGDQTKIEREYPAGWIK